MMGIVAESYFHVYGGVYLLSWDSRLSSCLTTSCEAMLSAIVMDSVGDSFLTLPHNLFYGVMQFFPFLRDTEPGEEGIECGIA